MAQHVNLWPSAHIRPSAAILSAPGPAKGIYLPIYCPGVDKFLCNGKWAEFPTLCIMLYFKILHNTNIKPRINTTVLDVDAKKWNRLSVSGLVYFHNLTTSIYAYLCGRSVKLLELSRITQIFISIHEYQGNVVMGHILDNFRSANWLLAINSHSYPNLHSISRS